MDIVLLTCIIVAVGVFISSMEDLFIERRLFQENLFDWRYCLVFQPVLKPARARPVWNSAFGATAFRISVAIRVLSIVVAAILIWQDSGLAVYAVAICVVSYLYLFYRFPYSLDGSDQMILFVLIGLLIMSFDSGDGSFIRLGAFAVVLQAAIAYLTSGMAKLVSPIWRSGDALSGVMSCGEFGSAHLATVLSARPHLSKALSWCIMLGHVFVGISFLYGGQIIVAAIIIATLFHLSIAFFMRLNIFVWSFGATFPSAIYLSDFDQRILIWNDIVINIQ